MDDQKIFNRIMWRAWEQCGADLYRTLASASPSLLLSQCPPTELHHQPSFAFCIETINCSNLA